MGYLEKTSKLRTAGNMVVMFLIGCFICLLSGWGDSRISNGNSAVAKVDLSRLRVQDEEGRSGLPVIVLDKDGNIIGTHGGKALKRVTLDYANQMIDGEFDMDAPAEYRIESGAFSACSNMTRLVVWNFSDRIAYIADDAFEGCPSDLTVYCDKDTYIWKRLQELGIQREELLNENNMGQKGIGDLTREELRESDGDPFFYMVEGGVLFGAGGSVHNETMCFDTGVEYPSEARKIDSFVFMHVSGMEAINIPPYIEEIADSAFMDTMLKKVDFELDGGKTELRRIGVNAFMQADLSNSSKLVIPEGVTEIGQGAFEMCPGLKEVILPKSLKVIGGSCFYGCNNLKKVTVLSPDVEYRKNSWNQGKAGVFGLCGVKYLDKADEFTKSETVIRAPKGSTTEAYVKKHATKDEMQEGLRFQGIE